MRCSHNSERELLFERFPGFALCHSGKSNVWAAMSGVMIRTRENRSASRKTCPTTTFSTTDITRTDFRLKPGLGGEEPADYPPEPRHGV